MIGRCDEYVVFDSVQFAKRHWHNRNKIKTPKGPEWITIPVVSKSRFEQPINEVLVAESWAEKHWRSIELNYRKAQFFIHESGRVRGWFEEAAKLERLTDINRFFLKEITSYMELPVRITSDTSYPAGELRRTARLLHICQAAGATHYVSGPSAREYFDEKLFEDAGIAVEWHEYGPYSPYPQQHGEFEDSVTILDAIFNLGPRAIEALHPRKGTGS